MGGAKPVAELGGEPLIARPVRAAADAGLDVVVVAKAATPLPALREALAREASMRGTLAAMNPDTFEAEERLVASVNTPEELAAAHDA
jgi:molybdopterin-guanine dinucleotide biosynthesis protein A